MTKLLDAFGGLALAILTLSGLAVSATASAAYGSAAQGALGRAEATGDAIRNLDPSAIARGTAAAPGVAGNVTCFTSSSEGTVVLGWRFVASGKTYGVSVSCVGP